MSLTVGRVQATKSCRHQWKHSVPSRASSLNITSIYTCNDQLNKCPVSTHVTCQVFKVMFGSPNHQRMIRGCSRGASHVHSG
jgi:hypothetical protein